LPLPNFACAAAWFAVSLSYNPARGASRKASLILAPFMFTMLESLAQMTVPRS
jgi:hypothetical protein